MSNLKYKLSPMTPRRAWKEQGLYIAAAKAKRLADPEFAELRRRYDHAWLWLLFWLMVPTMMLAALVIWILETTGIA